MPKCTRFDTFLQMEWLPTRVVLGILTMLGIANMVMVRVNLSIAIVAMVRQRSSGNASNTIQTHCNQNPNTTEDYVTESWLTETLEDNTTLLMPMNDLEEWEERRRQGIESQRLDWDDRMQGLVLGSFFYGYWISQVGGGRLAEMYGTKLMLGVVVFSGALAAFLTPIAAKAHYLVLVILRALQGFMQGPGFPCTFPMIVRWVPRYEQSKFISYAVFSHNISITITMALCGMVIDFFGWEAAFYVTGGLSFTWCILWYKFMYDTPEEHPSITQDELRYIVKTTKMCPSHDEGTSYSSPLPVPWKSMARSLSLWALIICDAGNSYGYTLYFSYLPTYIEKVIGISISHNGFLSALPFLLRYMGAVVFATTGECLLTREIVSMLTMRRIFSALAMFGPAVSLLVVAYSGCNPSLAVFFLCLGFFMNGAITTGCLANRADLSFNFAGTVAGFSNAGANVISILVPVVVSNIIYDQQTIGAWKLVFWTCVPIYAVTEVFYLLFVSTSRQPWDLIEMKNVQSEPQDVKDDKEDTERAESCKTYVFAPENT